MTPTQKVCTRCLCLSTVPGITFNEQGTCSECLKHTEFQEQYFAPSRYRVTMEKRFQALREECIPYHVMVMLSGGKDSAYLLYLLKEVYHLRPLAFSVIHPFVNSLAVENMENTARALNVDLKKFYPDESLIKAFIRHGILHGSDYGLNEFFGCALCSALYHLLSLKTALSLKIPYLIDGCSPGEQAFPSFTSGINMAKHYLKDNPYHAFRQLLFDACGEEYRGTIYDFSFDEFSEAQFPAKLSPLSFLEYDHEQIIDTLAEQGILNSRDSQPADTNCDVQHFFAYLSYKRYNCHPYIRHFSLGIRKNMPTLLDEFIGSGEHRLSREEHMTILEELKSILFALAEHPETRLISADEQAALAPLCIAKMGRESFSNFVERLWKILPRYARYFNMNL